MKRILFYIIVSLFIFGNSNVYSQDPIYGSNSTTWKNIDSYNQWEARQTKIRNTIISCGYVVIGGLATLPLYFKHNRLIIKHKFNSIRKQIKEKKDKKEEKDLVD